MCQSGLQQVEYGAGCGFERLLWIMYCFLLALRPSEYNENFMDHWHPMARRGYFSRR